MAVADTKKCQDFINAGALCAMQLQLLVTELKELRTLFQSVNPSTVGTALEGNTVAVSNWINSLDDLDSGAVATGLISAYVPTHSKGAL